MAKVPLHLLQIYIRRKNTRKVSLNSIAMKTPRNLTGRHEQGSARLWKVAFILLLTGLLTVASVAKSVAQQTGALPEVTITGTSLKVNERALKSFNRSFKDAEEPRWFLVENKRYLVKHLMNDMRHNTLYGRRGAFIYDVGYGVEKDLPGTLLSQVKRSYKDYGVTTAINVRQGGRDIWKINMENDKNIVILHAQDGIVTEQDRFDKSSPASLTAFRVQEQSIEDLISDFE